MRTRLRSKVSLLFLAFAVVIFAVAGTAMALTSDTSGDTSGTTSSSPTISSDKDDYAPGELVTLTGSGWQPGESVHINVDDDQTKTWNRDVDVTADANGEITDSFNLPDWFVATYKVTATGEQSGTVTTSFTDANPSDVVVNPTSATVQRGASATYEVRVFMGGSNAQCTTTLSASDLPANTTHSFSDNPRTGNSNYSSTLTVNTTAMGNEASRTPLGSDPFSVKMTRGSNCQGSGDISSVGVLVVNPRAPSGLQATANGPNSIDLSWTASPDSNAISKYVVFEGTTAVASTANNTTTSATINDLQPQSTHTYTVKARYTSGTTNYDSVASNSSTATTASADSTAPTTTASAKNADNSTYTGGSWTNQNVTVTLNAQDNDGGSGVKEIRYTTNGTNPTASSGTVYSAPFPVSSTTTVKFLAVDAVGNVESVKSFQVNIDKIAPAPNCGSASANWLGTDASIACAPTDGGGSGLASSVPATFNLVTNVAAGTEDANASTNSREISDVAGNKATAGPISGNMVDKKAPSVVPADVINNTWRNSSLSQSFTSTDGGSGLANAAADSSFTLTASAESANANTPTVISRDVKDAVGNTTTRKVSALIDLTNPNISDSVINQPAPSGWYNLSTGGPQVDFECSDALSGIQSCPEDRTITDEGSNVGYSGTAYDVAGNSKSVSGSGLQVDLTAPDVAGAPDLLASSDSGDSTDNLTNVRMPTFDISAEAGSTVKLYAKKNGVETFLGQATATGGVARITSGTALDDGTYDVYGKVTDQAGNVSSTNGIQITIVTIDGTAPDAPGLDMDAASDTGVSNSDDKTSNDKPKFNGTAEAGSTLKLYDGATLITSFQVGAGGTWTFTLTSALSEGTHQIKATATDAADNTSDESQLSVLLDKTAPGVSPGDVNDTTWRNTALSQAFTASDSGSGLAPNQGLDASDGFTLTASAQSANASTPTTVSKTVSDVAGNTTTRSVSALIDLTKPTLSPTVSPNPVVLNGSATATPNGSDGLSGIATESCGPVVTNTAGPQSVSCSATDKAGNTANASAQYSVGFKFVGFSSPVDNNNVLNSAKAGQAIPLKWQLLDANNQPVTTLAGVTVTVASLSCPLGVTPDAVEEYAAGSSGLQNLGGGYYQFNWKTPTNYANSCKTMHLNLGEGKDANGNTITRTALFKFTK